MRIVISGTHFSGKSTLVEALPDALPQYTTIEEPYHLLQEEGYEFALSCPQLKILNYSWSDPFEKLKEIVLQNSFDFELDVLEVTGSPKTLSITSS